MNLKQQQIIHYTLSVAVAMCFIGHGIFGVITKAVWCNYFAVFGFSQQFSYQAMPFVGMFDMLLGVMMLIYPVRAIPAWLVLWGIFTALLRPLSGEPFAEFIERAGNFGAPLALLFLWGMPAKVKDWFSLIKPSKLIKPIYGNRIESCLKIIVFLVLVGHGWLNIIGKSALLKQYASLGFYNTRYLSGLIGAAEITIALLILLKPLRQVLFAALIWKLTSELFYPDYALIEWIERGGSYGAMVALIVMWDEVFIKKLLERNHAVIGRQYLPKGKNKFLRS